MTSHTEEYEFVLSLFSYVFNRRGILLNPLSSSCYGDYSYSKAFSAQIGRTVLLLSYAFQENLTKHFKIIFPHILRSRKHFVTFLNAFLTNNTLEAHEYLLDILGVSAIVLEFSIFCHIRGHENAISFTATCLTEVLEAQNTNFYKCGGWENLKIESIPFSRAYCVLQYLIERANCILQIDPLVLTSDLVERAFDASTSVILQEAFGMYPLVPTFQVGEVSLIPIGYNASCESEFENSYTNLDFDSYNNESVIDNGDYCINYGDRHFVTSKDDINEGKQDDLVLKHESLSEVRNETESFSPIEEVDENSSNDSNDILIKPCLPSILCPPFRPINYKGSEAAKTHKPSQNQNSLFDGLQFINHINNDAECLYKPYLSSVKVICHSDDSKTVDRKLERATTPLYGVPNWKRRILQLRQERKERRFTRGHRCKDKECQTQISFRKSKPILPNLEQYLESRKTYWANTLNIPISDLYWATAKDLQTCSGFNKNGTTSSTQSDDKENRKPVETLEDYQTENVHDNVKTASIFLSTNNTKALKIFKNTKQARWEPENINIGQGLKLSTGRNIAQNDEKVIKPSFDSLTPFNGAEDCPCTTKEELSNNVLQPISQKKLKKLENKCKKIKGRKKKR